MATATPVRPQQKKSKQATTGKSTPARPRRAAPKAKPQPEATPVLTIDSMKAEIESRLIELRPLVEEKETLERTLAALKGEVAQSVAPATPRRAGSPRSYGSGGKRAPRGANREAILKVVGEKPGITATEIAETTNIAKATVHTTVSQLKRKGILKPEGENGGVKLA